MDAMDAKDTRQTRACATAVYYNKKGNFIRQSGEDAMIIIAMCLCVCVCVVRVRHRGK